MTRMRSWVRFPLRPRAGPATFKVSAPLGGTSRARHWHGCDGRAAERPGIPPGRSVTFIRQPDAELLRTFVLGSFLVVRAKIEELHVSPFQYRCRGPRYITGAFVQVAATTNVHHMATRNGRFGNVVWLEAVAFCAAWAAFWMIVDRLSRRGQPYPGERPAPIQPLSVGEEAERWLQGQR
jgi:hypothetical protein